MFSNKEVKMPDKLSYSRLKEILQGGDLEEIITELSQYFDFITFVSSHLNDNNPSLLKLEGTPRLLDKSITDKAEYVYTEYDSKWRYYQIAGLPTTIMLKLLNGKITNVVVAALFLKPPPEGE